MSCFECRRKAAYRHHVIPKSRGGKKTVPLCWRCHSLVHGRRALDTAELTRIALQHLRASGMKTGGDVPFGYRARQGKLYRDAKDQEAVRLVLGLRKKGGSLRDICRDLASAGITPKRGGAWHPTAVSRIVERACYASSQA